MDLKLPNLGEGADSGTVVNLFVKEGDTIAKDQPILELENEKAVATIPSTAAGTVTQIYVKPGDKIKVGQRILSVGEGAVAPAFEAVRKEPAPARSREPIIQTPSPEQLPVALEEEPLEPGPETKAGTVPAAAPSIRKLARELGIDLTRVRAAHGAGVSCWRMCAPTSRSCSGLRPHLDLLLRLAPPLPNLLRSKSISPSGDRSPKLRSRRSAKLSPAEWRKAGPTPRALPNSTRPT